MRSKKLLYDLVKTILLICFLWGGNFVFSQECEWIEAPTQTYSQYKAVAVDENNDVISVGNYPQGFSIQNIVFPSPVRIADGFVAKFTNSGVIKWATQVIPNNSTSSANFYQVETDKQNNIYTIGYLSGSVSFGNGISAANSSGAVVIVKYNTSGIAQWANIIEDSGGHYDQPRLAIGNNGDVFVGFTLRASTYFNGTNHSLQTLIGNFFFPSVGVVKYSTNGNFIFAKSFGGLTSYNQFERITIDQHNNLYFLAASLYGATIGSKTYNNSGHIIIKTDSAINIINSRMIVTTQAHVFTLNAGVYISISAQDNGKFVLSGRFADTVDFGGVTLVCQNGGDGSINGNSSNSAFNICIAYYDSSLNAVWARKETTQSKRVVTSSDGGVKIKNGFIFLGGVYRRGDTQFGDTFLPAIDSTNLITNYSAFIAKMDSLGNFLWAFTLGRGIITNVAIDNNFNSFITGFYQDSIQLFNKKVVSNSLGQFLSKIKDYRIVRGCVSEGPYCAGDSIEIPYTKYGRYDSANQFIAQLSDSAGNFDGGQRELGRLTSTEDGIVKGKLPLFNVATNNKYRIRIISTNPIVQSFYIQDTLQLLIYSKDTANAGSDLFVCKGQSVHLGTTGGSKWNWSPANFMLNPADTSNRQPLIMPDSAVEYRIIISDSSGCGVTDTDYVKIFMRPELSTSISGDSMACRGFRQTLQAITTGGDSTQYWYVWKTLGFNIINSTTSSFTIRPIVPTQYMVITGDSCSSKIDTAYFTVNVQNNLKVITTPDTSICLGNSITLSVAGMGCNPNKYTHEWFEVGNSNVISNNDSITVSPTTSKQYRVILKDTSTLLVDTAHIKVTVYQPMQLTLNADSTICVGEKAELRATATGGNPNTRNILWTANNQQVSINNAVQVTPTTTTTYKALLSDGCSLQNDSAFIKITVRPKLEITVNADTTICIGESSELRAVTKGGLTASHKLLWTANNQQLSTSNQLQVTPATTTIYWATLSDGCTTPNDSAKITVSVRPPLKVTLNPDTTICVGETITLKATPSGGSPNTYQQLWTVVGGQLTDTNNTVQVAPTITTTYKAVLKDNCTSVNDSATTTITVRPPLSIKGIAKDSICANQILLLTSTPQGGYIPNHQIQWFADGGLWISAQNPATDTPKINKKYIVQLSDNCSPTVYDTLDVIVLPVPQANFIFNPTQGCPPLTVNLQDNSTGNDTTLNSWTIGSTEYQSKTKVEHQFTQTGTYSLRLSVVNVLGCAHQKVQTNVITVYPKPKADFIVKPDIKETEEPLTLLNRSSTNTVIWDMGDGNQLIPNPIGNGDTAYTYQDTGWLNLSLIAQNKLGCFDTAIQRILLYDKVHCIIPSAFTPNGDQLNNTFSPVCVGVASYTLTIYNRWGQMIFQRENGAWDGTYNDTPVPDDVYMYKLQIQADSKKKKLTYGTVQVIR